MSKSPLEPLPYHREVVAYLKNEEAGLWNWFASGRMRQEQAEASRLDLLKSTYRLERDSHKDLYEVVDRVLLEFELGAPITCYQAQSGGGLNAALVYLPGEIHVVLSGPVEKLLSREELRALFGHEVAHFLLLEKWDGEFRIAADLLRALNNDAAASPVHVESMRLFNLYTEVFADRGAYSICRDATVAVSTLVKIETGLPEVNAESYLRQADEIFSKTKVQADQLTHPEPYIRARALKLWSEQGDNSLSDIVRMIQGPPALNRLDLVRQRQVSETTRRLIQTLLVYEGFHSEPMLAHARLYFDDFKTEGVETDLAALTAEFDECDAELRDYYCYVLLDFAAVDREIFDATLPLALAQSNRFGLGERFAEIAAKELGLSKKQFAKIERAAAEIESPDANNEQTK